MNSLLLLRASHVNPDPRVARAVSVAEDCGLDVTVIGWDRDGDAPPCSRLGQSRVVRYSREAAHGRGVANLVALMLFQGYIATQVWRRRKDLVAIHACDLSTGFTGLLLARLLRVRLVYDIFDYFADSFPVPAVALPLVRRVETWVIERADVTLLPTATREQQIRPARPKRLVVVENSPDIRELPAADLPLTDLAYVGILAEHRLLAEVVQLVAANPSRTLRIAGFGPLEERIRALAATAPNIEFVGRVDSDEALRIQASARVLFATYDPAVRNHRFSAANKLSEAFALGKPLIVCRDTAMDVAVEESGLGVVIDYDVKAFAEALERLTSNADALDDCAVRGPELYRGRYAWQVSADRLADVYRDAGAPG